VHEKVSNWTKKVNQINGN